MANGHTKVHYWLGQVRPEMIDTPVLDVVTRYNVQRANEMACSVHMFAIPDKYRVACLNAIENLLQERFKPFEK